MIKKERIRILPDTEAWVEGSHPATVDFVNFVGADTEYHCSVKGISVVVRVPRTEGQAVLAVGTHVRLHWDPRAVCLLTAEES
jgi:hypothetical protein